MTMDWPIPILKTITTMSGPDFLILYGTVVALTLAVCWWTVRRRDPTGSLPVPPVPSEPNPYEISYLRGGANELIRLLVFDLARRGYLLVTGDKDQQIKRAPNHPDRHKLSAIQRCAFDWFSTPRTVKEVFEAGGLPLLIEEHSAQYRERLRCEQLLTPGETDKAARAIWLVGVLVLVGLGGYKLMAAMGQGHSNVWFLILMLGGSLLVLTTVCQPPRLSERGRTYLQRLQAAFESSKESLQAISGQASQTALLLVGLFGISVLSGTVYNRYTELFPRSSSGSHWFFSSDGCGSCGGGCGGCGGCGD